MGSQKREARKFISTTFDTNSEKGIWDAQFSAYLLRSRLMLVDRVSRLSPVASGQNEFYDSLNENKGNCLPISKAIAIGCWCAYNANEIISDLSVKSVNGIITKSWNDLNNGDFDDWGIILKSFFENITNETLSNLNKANFTLYTEESYDVLADLWKLVFNEIARNNNKNVSPSQLICIKKNNSLIFTWKSIFEGNETKIRENWGTKKHALPQKGRFSYPGKPLTPGSGWGQYGNYVIVNQILQQPYVIFWDTINKPNLHEWTTQITLAPPVINWRKM